MRRASAHQARKQARKDARLQNQQVTSVPEPVEPAEQSTTSQAQIDANRANAQLSCGPKTVEGKAISSQNRRYHGLAGAFQIMPWEDPEAFVTLQNDLRTHYHPIDLVEQAYVDRLAQHMWSRQRCIDLQADCFDLEDDTRFIEDEKQFALLARYQAQNERGMDKCVNMLAKFRAARQKEQIGFESQNRKETAETRKKEAHEARLRLINARAKHIELDSEIRQTIEAPIPGNMRIPFEELAGCFRDAIRDVSQEIRENEAAA
jgi:hypothetical protein